MLVFNHFTAGEMAVVLAVDLEVADLGVLDGYVFAVGVAVVKKWTHQVVLKRRFVIKPDAALDRVHETGADFFDVRVDAAIRPYIDPRVYDSILGKELDTLCVLTDEMQSQPATWEDVAKQLQTIFVEYGDVELVSDCPDFDFGLLNVRLVQRVPWVNRRGVRWMGGNGKHANMRDPYEELAGFSSEVQKQLIAAAKRVCAHTHFPDDYALHLAVLQSLLLLQLG